MRLGEVLVTRGQVIEELRRRIKILWGLACAADGVKAGSMFVVFSDDNRYAKRYNAVAQELASMLADRKS